MKNANADNSELMTQLSEIQNTMSDKIFLRFSNFIRTELGINMTDAKKVMLQARLQKRMRKLGITTFSEYYDYVFSPQGVEKELPNMIDVVTTNKTDFFREAQHFDYLIQKVLPELIRKIYNPLRKEQKKKALFLKGEENSFVKTEQGFFSPDNESEDIFKKKIMVWSAGCSSGEEAYTLAMVLSEFSEKVPMFNFSVLGTDISTKVLREADAGIYPHERVEPVPLMLRKKYLLKSKDKSKGLVRIAPELRALVKFRRINLMSYDFGMREMMDIIFCRNVLIYFDRKTQQGVLNRICRHLKPGGYIFMGHSETLSGLDLPLMPVTSTVYKKTGV